VICQATRVDLERFRAAIVDRIGLQFDDAKLGFLGEVLQRRLDKLGHSSEAYVWGLQRGTANGEIAALARELTVGETYFFRNIEQFHALAEVALPERMGAECTPRSLRLLSAGCASGEEAYSMAIVARQTIADPSWGVSIRAVDLNPAVLEKARAGRYSAWALRETPHHLQQTWFQAAGRDFTLDPSIRSSVTFEVRNLASEDPELWPASHYDVVFCRNVLMYFSSDQMRGAIARIAQSLAPGGFLFLGHAETLRGVSDRFHLRHTHGTFYYELKSGDEVGRTTWGFQSSPQPRVVAPVASFDAGDEWFDAIRKASERVAALVPVSTPVLPDDRTPPSVWDPAPALRLLREERYAEALDHVRSKPATSEQDPDLVLLEATLLVHGGDLAAAETMCRRLLLIDEFNAGAHYVLALCREQSAQVDRAAEHYRVAAYLDPDFAMPRLHLGLLARRSGKRDVARRELSEALALLKREQASRLLLFGGGFSREALVALCSSALKECGGRP
jgi:chemotaxis protein methyltransferase CheR